MRIGTERDGDAFLECELENSAAGIDFFAILAQAGRVEVQRAAALLRRDHELLVQRRVIAGRLVTKFLRQIRVADDVKKTGLRRHGQTLDVRGPDLPRITIFLSLDFFRVIVLYTVEDVLHGAVEVLSWIT